MRKYLVLGGMAIVGIGVLFLGCNIAGCSGGQDAVRVQEDCPPDAAYCPAAPEAQNQTPSAGQVYGMNTIGRLAEPVRAVITSLDGQTEKRRLPAGTWIVLEEAK